MCRRTTKEQLEWRIDNFLQVFHGKKYGVDPINHFLDRWHTNVCVGDRVDFPNKRHGITTATVMKIIKVTEHSEDCACWRAPKIYVLMKTVNGQWVTHATEEPMTFTNIIKINYGG